SSPQLPTGYVQRVISEAASPPCSAAAVVSSAGAAVSACEAASVSACEAASVPAGACVLVEGLPEPQAARTEIKLIASSNAKIFFIFYLLKHNYARSFFRVIEYQLNAVKIH